MPIPPKQECGQSYIQQPPFKPELLHFLFLSFHKLLLDDVSTVNDRVLEGLGISLHYDCASRYADLNLDILVVVVREKGKGHIYSAYGIIESLEF